MGFTAELLSKWVDDNDAEDYNKENNRDDQKDNFLDRLKRNHKDNTNNNYEFI